ncbi:glycosyltransferase family 4 protein [Rhodopila sp.]|uniref:glycosyltransferase family 4 protein n=1 Tax=Rhodopila sp. TaxID=2480087 RepID=UPI003D1254D1
MSSVIPSVAVVLPPREGFGPGRAGAIGLLVRRLVQTPGFDTVVFGGRQDGPVFPGIRFQSIGPSVWTLGNTNIRYAAAVGDALKALKPALVEVHNRPEIALALASRLNSIPVTAVIHNDPQAMREANSPLQRTVLLGRLARVVTNSEYLRRRLMDGVNAPTRLPVVLPNCLDFTELPPQGNREKLILFAGRVVADKAPDVFVTACAAALPDLPGWRAEIIGADRFSRGSPDTAFIKMVRALAESAGVRMLGYRDHPEVLAAMARAAIVVVPSRWAEPFGLVALEALASGAALICSRRGALPEVAGDAAVYADPDHSAEIAAAIGMLAHDESRRTAMAAAGRQRARQFDVAVVVQKLAALRRDVLNVAARRD